MSTLVIDNVDLDQLEKQRLVLAELMYYATDDLEQNYINALDGILNMLDEWSDTRASRKRRGLCSNCGQRREDERYLQCERCRRKGRENTSDSRIGMILVGRCYKGA